MEFDDKKRTNNDELIDLLETDDKASIDNYEEIYNKSRREVILDEINDSEYLSDLYSYYFEKMKEKCPFIDASKLAKALWCVGIHSNGLENIYAVDKYIFFKRKYPNGFSVFETAEDIINNYTNVQMRDFDNTVMSLKSAVYYRGTDDTNFTHEFKEKVNNDIFNCINTILLRNNLGRVLFGHGRIYYDQRDLNIYINKCFYEICHMVKNNIDGQIDFIVEKDDVVNLYSINISNGKIKLGSIDKEAVTLFEKNKSDEKSERTRKSKVLKLSLFDEDND